MVVVVGFADGSLCTVWSLVFSSRLILSLLQKFFFCIASAHQYIYILYIYIFIHKLPALLYLSCPVKSLGSS